MKKKMLLIMLGLLLSVTMAINGFTAYRGKPS